MDEKRSLQRKVNKGDELVACIMNSPAMLTQERQDDLRKTISTIAKRELKSALKSMVRFLNTYFELLQFI
jgi:thermostable 8-oxoguanine DNA glycosylase